MWGGASHGALPSTANVIPATTGVYDVGSSSKKYRDGYFSRNLYVGDNILFDEVTTQFCVGVNTSAASDNKNLFMGACSDVDTARSGHVWLYGANSGGSPGLAQICSASISTGEVLIKSYGSSGLGIRLATGSSGLLRASVTPGGDFLMDVTNGGDIIQARAANGVIIGKATLPTDMTGLFGKGGVNIIKDVGMVVCNGTNLASGALLYLCKTRATDGSADTIVQASDQVFNLAGYAADGATYRPVGSITLFVTGTPAVNDIATQMVFYTRAAGAGAMAAAMTLDSSQNIIAANKILGGGVATTYLIGVNTTAGVDSGVLYLTGGSTTTPADGASLTLNGGDTASGGLAALYSAETATGYVNIGSYGSSGDGINFRTGAALDKRLAITPGGDAVMDASTGGDIYIVRSGKGLKLGLASFPAAITSFFGTGRLMAFDASNVNTVIVNGSNSNNCHTTYVGKGRESAGAATTPLQNGDKMYQLAIGGADGASYRIGARIIVQVNGTVASNDLPTEIQFHTRYQGASNDSISMTMTSEKWLHIYNTPIVPSSNPTSSGYIYVSGGALKYRGSSGTVTDIAPA